MQSQAELNSCTEVDRVLPIERVRNFSFQNSGKILTSMILGSLIFLTIGISNPMYEILIPVEIESKPNLDPVKTDEWSKIIISLFENDADFRKSYSRHLIENLTSNPDLNKEHLSDKFLIQLTGTNSRPEQEAAIDQYLQTVFTKNLRDPYLTYFGSTYMTFKFLNEGKFALYARFSEKGLGKAITSANVEAFNKSAKETFLRTEENVVKVHRSALANLKEQLAILAKKLQFDNCKSIASTPQKMNDFILDDCALKSKMFNELSRPLFLDAGKGMSTSSLRLNDISLKEKNILLPEEAAVPFFNEKQKYGYTVYIIFGAFCGFLVMCTILLITRFFSNTSIYWRYQNSTK